MKKWSWIGVSLVTLCFYGAVLYGAFMFLQWISDWGTTDTLLFLSLVGVVTVILLVGDSLVNVIRDQGNLNFTNADSLVKGLDALRTSLVSKHEDSLVQEVGNINIALVELLKVAEEQTMCFGAIERLLEPSALSSLEQIGWDHLARLRKKMDETVAQASKQDRRWIIMRDGTGRLRRVYWGEISAAREKGWVDA